MADHGIAEERPRGGKSFSPMKPKKPKDTPIGNEIFLPNTSSIRDGALKSNSSNFITSSSTDTLTNKTIDANATGNSITNIDLTADVINDLPIAEGGTGQSSQTAGFDALAPTTTKGDVIVSDGTDNIRLAVGTNTQVLTADSAEASGVKWGAAGGGAMEFIAKTTTSASQAAVTFSSLSLSSYDMVMFAIHGANDGTVANRAVKMTLNNDTGANYQWSILTNSTLTSGSSPVHMELGDMVHQSQAFSSIIKGFLHLDSDTSKKNIKWESWNRDQPEVAHGGGFYNITTAITRIDFTMTTDNWDNNSVITLWGIKNS